MIEKQQIIISHYRQGLSIRQIAKTMSLNRKTVKRYVVQYSKERNEGSGVIHKPRYDTSKRTKVKLTKVVTDIIDEMLRNNEDKRTAGRSKQCMAATDIHDHLVNLGHQISYRTVCRYVQDQKAKGSEIFIKQEHMPGKASEFDWGHVVLEIGGKVKRLLLAVFTACYSNHRWATLFYREDMPSFLDAHVKYFHEIGGVPLMMIYDNMKVAVARYTIRQSDKKPTEDLLKISSYYQFDYRFCNTRRANEKGHVEKSVEYVRRKAFSLVDQFDTLQQANQHLACKLNELNNKSAKEKDRSIMENFHRETKCFVPLPVSAYEISTTLKCKIDKYHTIQIDTNHYSVPEQIQSPAASVKIYPTSVHVLDAKGQIAARHERKNAKGQWVIDINHYWHNLNNKPGALPSSMAMAQADDRLKRLFQDHFQSCPRDFIKLILYCREKQIELNHLEKTLDKHKNTCPNSPPESEKIIFLLSDPECVNGAPISNPQPESMSAMIAEQCNLQLRQIQNLIQ